MMDPAIVDLIQQRLDAVIRDENVALPLAIESGSRAWGFPSPDSDYDCRFIYVRRREDYLALWPRRDVIETPLDAIFDVNGWDLAKALKLLVAGNAVAIEWLTSPMSYRRDPAFSARMLALAEAVVDRDRIIRHYLYLGEIQRQKHFADLKTVKRKKLFYALRPAAALRWMRLHPDAAIAPMHFPTLMRECDPPAEVAGLVEALIAEKAQTKELGTAPVPPILGAFIDAEFRHAHSAWVKRPVREDAKALAQAFFLEALEAFAPAD